MFSHILLCPDCITWLNNAHKLNNWKHSAATVCVCFLSSPRMEICNDRQWAHKLPPILITWTRLYQQFLFSPTAHQFSAASRPDRTPDCFRQHHTFCMQQLHHCTALMSSSTTFLDPFICTKTHTHTNENAHRYAHPINFTSHDSQAGRIILETQIKLRKFTGISLTAQ